MAAALRPAAGAGAAEPRFLPPVFFTASLPGNGVGGPCFLCALRPILKLLWVGLMLVDRKPAST